MKTARQLRMEDRIKEKHYVKAKMRGRFVVKKFGSSIKVYGRDFTTDSTLESLDYALLDLTAERYGKLMTSFAGYKFYSFVHAWDGPEADAITSRTVRGLIGGVFSELGMSVPFSNGKRVYAVKEGVVHAI